MNLQQDLREAADFLRSRTKANLVMVILNVLVFAVLALMGDTGSTTFMLSHGACYVPLVLQGEYWRLLTSMFLHFGIVHLAYNMICLVALGDRLERAMGPVRYLLVYLIGGLAGNVCSCMVSYYAAAGRGTAPWQVMAGGGYSVSAGASGAVFAVIGALIRVVMKNHGQMGTITLRRIGLMTALMIAQGFMESGTDNFAHIGGLAAGFVIAFIVYRSDSLVGTEG